MENSCPKSPTMAANNIICWARSEPSPPGMGQNNPSWADEFAGFSTAKRRMHRRSISDVPTALVEEQAPESNASARDKNMETSALDDEAGFIMSMLNDLKDAVEGTTESSSDPASTSTSYKRRRGDENVKKQEEVESWKWDNNGPDQQPCQVHQNQNWMAFPPPSASDADNEAVHDPKRVKRILANRQSAQRSRVRKLQYISELERSMTRLQTEVSMLSPRVAYIDHQRTMLNVDNTALKSKIAALSHDKLFKDAHQEALKREIERLKQVYHQQCSVDDTATTTRNR